MVKILKIVLLTISLLAFVLTVITPLETSAQSCSSTKASWPNFDDWFGTSNVIYYYIQSGFADSMSSCTPQSDDDLTMDHIINTINSAAEMWNMESNGVALLYGGQINADFNSWCNNTVSVLKPAIYIEFVSGCQDRSAPIGVCDSNANASIFDSSVCSDGVRMQFYGDGDSTSCDSGSRNWVVDDNESHPNSYDLKVVAEHEFGHALNLGHPDPNTALMSGSGNGNVTKRHLYEWDQSCADDNQSAGRDITHKYRGLTSSGVWKGVASFVGSGWKRGSYSGGHTRKYGSGSERYSLYFDNEIRTSTVGADGFYSFTKISTPASSVSDLYVSPVFYTAMEFDDVSGKDNRITYISDYSGAGIPYVKYARNTDPDDSDLFESVVTGTYRECLLTPCYTASSIRSHVPMTSAWDEYSGVTVFARVRTERDRNTQGRIDVFPGFDSGNVRDLRVGSTLSGGTPSESFSLWNYRNRTDFPVGIACAPDRDELDYNCLIAWQDRGVPTGAVLYKYFRVNAVTKVIEWRPGNSSRRSGALSTSGISAAYFNGSFWMSFKVPLSLGGDVAYTEYNVSSGTAYTGWQSVTSLSRVDVVDPPTWLYSSHGAHEAALLWTESN